MPWQECKIMDERVKFISKLLDGEKMSQACREFGISRKTGYKIWNRYQNEGQEAITDRTRRPKRFGNQLPEQTIKSILRLKKDKPHWGAAKIRELFKRKYSDVKLPARSTFHTLFEKHGLVKTRRKRRYKARGTPLTKSKSPNDLWCADYKGEFMMGNKKYCYPLTITDHRSRFLISCEALTTTKQEYAFAVFKRAFREFGLPHAIRTDNGNPFSSVQALFGLSKLSIWWLRLGINIERIKPGNPQQNGRHERMHLTLKKCTTKPPGQGILQQQSLFDDFIDEFNFERPHEALDMKCPSEIYIPSKRKYEGIKPLDYPTHDKTVRVTHCGRICMGNKKINLSTVFSGQDVGVKEVTNGVWLVSFMEYDLGYFDLEDRKLTALDNPFGAKVLPMSQE